MNIKYWVLLFAIASWTETTLAQLPSTDRIDSLHRELQRSVEAQDIDKTKKITDLLIREVAKYRQQLYGNRPRKKPRLDSEYTDKKPLDNRNYPSNREPSLDSASTRKKPIDTQNRHQFGKELILETSTAYGNNSTICVVGEIRNSSRSPINNRIYAIADFFDRDNRYLGSKAKYINPSGILPNQTVDFAIETSQSKQLVATTVKLRFQGTNSEEKFYLYPTTKSNMTLPVSLGNNKCNA